MKSVDIKKVILQHNNFASAVMNTNYQTREDTISAYKNFIDSNELVASIIAPIKAASLDAPDLFKKNYNGVSVYSDPDIIKDKAILYKHLTYMTENTMKLKFYAHSIFFTSKKYNDAIRRLLETSVLPIINYIQLKLSELLTEAEDEEKRVQSTPIHNGDIFYGNNNQKVENGSASMKNVGNDNSKKTFTFQKESFFLGFVSAVISGLVVFGLEELIRYLISIL